MCGIWAAFIAQVSQFDPGCFVWVDETESDVRNHICKFGYELHGQTPQHHYFLFVVREYLLLLQYRQMDFWS